MKLKTCKGCTRLLPAEDAHFYRSQKDNRNFRGKCKDCYRAIAAASYRRDPQRHNARTSAARAIRIANGCKA